MEYKEFLESKIKRIKDSYFETACKNVTNAMSKKLQLSLFE